MRKRSTIAALVLTICLASACAVKNAPQINTETQWRLNTVSQLTDLQTNYTTFFKDVGDAARAGTLNAGQVAELNAIGYKFKRAIETANTEWLAYVNTPSGDHKTQVINAILAAEQILLQLTTTKAQMKGGVL